MFPPLLLFPYCLVRENVHHQQLVFCVLAASVSTHTPPEHLELQENNDILNVV